MAIYHLDITRDHCPMTFVKIKIELSKLQEDDELEVLLCEGEPLENVPRTAREQGYRVVDIQMVGDAVFKVIIKKQTNE
ncbi:MAG: sulfurtransferase TusA family protein [Tannerella sp.]|nr:sulfurtransferase TusA family protein [Tannerella sp.]